MPRQKSETGSPLADLRHAHGLSTERLAYLTGLSAKTIYRIEHGLNRPLPATLAVLAAVFGVEPRELVAPDDGAEKPKAVDHVRAARDEPSGAAAAVRAEEQRLGRDGPTSRAWFRAAIRRDDAMRRLEFELRERAIRDRVSADPAFADAVDRDDPEDPKLAELDRLAVADPQLDREREADLIDLCAAAVRLGRQRIARLAGQLLRADLPARQVLGLCLDHNRAHYALADREAERVVRWTIERDLERAKARG